MTPHTSPPRPRRVARLAPAAFLALAANLLVGCSQFIDESETAPVAEPSAVPATESSTPESTPSPVSTPSESNSNLRYVSSTASPCSMVWSTGAQLPRDYEWCLDETGEAVAGVRIGSCEVVAFRNQMYAVPGRTIMAGNGTLQNDPQFLDALTACKRRPATTR